MLLISKPADIADLFMHERNDKAILALLGKNRLPQRAMPFIEMRQSAAKEGEPVAWGVRSVNVAQS